MLFKYIKPLKNPDKSIAEIEQITKYKFPDSFVNLIRDNNGGRPEKNLFKTNKTERMFQQLLSFNKGDKVSVYLYLISSDSLIPSLVPFAIDPFGNIICIRKSDNAIIFIDLDYCNEEFVANSIDEFLNMLYTTEA